mmetsp:Transcript_11486/g.23433  ORF Transcript_11486/g.23433 Transcript_11486/m.23433 type:complete len:440 (+) Transcript_11486:189-1508(+)
MDRLGERGVDPERSRELGQQGNADRLPEDLEGQADRKVEARPSNPSSPARSQEGRSSCSHDSQDSECLAGEKLGRAQAEDPTAGLPSETSLQLDSIWSRNLGSIDLPKYAETHNTISFPGKLMLLLIHTERTLIKSGRNTHTAPIAWTVDGRAFAIRDREKLVKDWLPLFFPRGKFQSFSRKLYRWEFRQVLPRRDKPEKKDKEVVFAHPYFQRDQKDLMVYMRSVTAAGLRRRQQRAAAGVGTAASSAARAEAIAAVEPTASLSNVIQLPLAPQAISHNVDPFTSIGQTHPLAVQHLVNSLASSNAQINPFASLAFPMLDTHLQQQILLASLFNSANAQIQPPVDRGQLALGLLYGNTTAEAALLRALANAQASQRTAVNLHPVAPPSRLDEQKQDSEALMEFRERLRRRAAEMLVRGGNPPQQGEPPPDPNARQGGS